MKKKLSLEQIKTDARVVLNSNNQSVLKGGMKRFEELRNADNPDDSVLYDADSETYDR